MYQPAQPASQPSQPFASNSPPWKNRFLLRASSFSAAAPRKNRKSFREFRAAGATAPVPHPVSSISEFFENPKLFTHFLLGFKRKILIFAKWNLPLRFFRAGGAKWSRKLNFQRESRKVHLKSNVFFANSHWTCPAAGRPPKVRQAMEKPQPFSEKSTKMRESAFISQGKVKSALVAREHVGTRKIPKSFLRKRSKMKVFFRKIQKVRQFILGFKEEILILVKIKIAVSNSQSPTRFLGKKNQNFGKSSW